MAHRLALAACLGILSLFSGNAFAASQPNILLVVADDYGWNDVGYHGSEIKTPTLDKLASEGVKLNNYYVQPICTPTRSQLMSGKYQIHTGLQHGVLRIAQDNGLPLEDITLAQQLKNHGYDTHMVGKWHLGYYRKEYTPTYRGFNSFFGYYNGAEDYYTHMIGNGLDWHHDEGTTSKPVNITEYSAFEYAKQVEGIVNMHDNQKPLFVYMPFQSVHSPLQVPDKYVDMYSHIKDKNRREFAGMVSCMDEAIANITQAYMAKGIWNNTIMIFSTDNGGQIYAGGNNWPLRGWKASLWEGGMRGVGFVHGPMLKTEGTTYSGLVHVSDWYPTLVNLVGGSTAHLNLDGHDVWQAVSQGSASPRTELLHNIDPLMPTKGKMRKGSPFDVRTRAAIRVGDWKLITGDPGNGSWIPPPHLTRYTKVDIEPTHLPHDEIPGEEISPSPGLEKRIKKGQNLWLFNLKDDPYERMEVSKKYPKIVKNLLEKLASYNSTAVPCRYPKPDPKANPKLHGGVWQPWQD